MKSLRAFVTLNHFLGTMMLLLLAASSVSGANNPVPFASTPLVPAAAPPGGPSFTLTVNGAGFTPGSVVNWNGSPRSTTFVSSTKVTATILSADIQSSAAASVTVTNPAPGGGTSAPLLFLVTNPAPFTARISPMTGGSVTELVADVNNDGKPDVVYVGNPIGGGGSGSQSTVCILLGDGKGNFASGPFYSGPALGPRFAPALLAGDFNNDGNVDIVSLAQGLILLGHGDGTFTPLQNVPVNLAQAVIGDFNGDGKLDIAGFAPFPDEKVYILNGNGDGTFTQGFVFDFSTLNGGYLINGLDTGDVDGNGTLDLVVSVGAQGTGNLRLALLKGNGDGTFASPVPILTGTAGTGSPVLADFNGDGKLDVAFASGLNTVEILFGNGDGTFGNATSLAVSPATVQSILVGDFNGDGQLDFNFGNEIFFGKGDGTFPSSLVLSNYNYGGNVAADFDLDGKLDILGPMSSGGVSLVLQQPLPSGDFTGTIDPEVLTVRAGYLGNYNLNVIPLNGFNLDVTLSVTGLPAYGPFMGPNYSFTPINATVPGGSVPATLTIFTSSQSTPGTYNVTFTGTTPTVPPITHSKTVTMEVLPFAPDFTGSLTNSTASVQSGGSATYGISIFPINGFTGSVQLSASALPPGASASFSPNPVTGGSGSTTLTISTTAATPTGRFYPQISGTSGSLTHGTTLILDVNSPADFTGDVEPRQQTVVRGSTATFNGVVVPLSGFNRTVSLSASGLPANVTANFVPSLVTGGSGTYTLAISAASNAVPGTYPVTISGTSLTVTHSLILTVVVQ